MEIVDAQVHTWFPDTPHRPWISSYREVGTHSAGHRYHVANAVDPQSVLLRMAEAGVDAAILSPVGVYGETSSVELEAARMYPRSFAVMGWVDHLSHTVGDDLRTLMLEPAFKAVRLLKFREDERRAKHEFDAVLAACAQLRLPVAVSLVQPLDKSVKQTFEAHPDVTFIVDHAGVGYAPPIFPVPESEGAFDHLPAVLDLASLPNVHLKLTGVPALSRESFPFRDVWDPVIRLVESFGVDRTHWGSDFTRTNGWYSYDYSVRYLQEMNRFSDDELSQLYGASLLATLKWDR